MADAPNGADLAIVGKRKPGRPPKLSADARRAVLTFLCQSMSREEACQLVGCTTRTLKNTIKRDPEFKSQVHQAELSGQLGAAACVTLAAQTDPKIALAYLERLNPQRWGKPQRVNLEVAGAGADGQAVRKQLLAKLGITDLSPAPAAEGAPVAASEPAPSG